MVPQGFLGSRKGFLFIQVILNIVKGSEMPKIVLLGPRSTRKHFDVGFYVEFLRVPLEF